jgi:hypothetical protein
MLRKPALNRLQGNRHGNRLRLGVPAALQLTHKTRHCLIDNISPTGARLRIDEPLGQGRSVKLHFHELRLFGIVMWCRGGECGIRFDKQLEREDMEGFLWIASHPKAYGNFCQKIGAREWSTGFGS